MINLLPPEQKKQIRAGQSNVMMLRYCIASLILAILLGGLVVVTYLTLKNARNSAEASLAEGQAKSQKYSQVQQQATEFNNNLSIAKTILDKEVRYSQVAVKIAQVLPPGIVLQSLQLNADSFGKPMILDAYGKSYEDAIRLKTALEESDIFHDVHIISATTAANADNGYPVAISMSVIIDGAIVKS